MSLLVRRLIPADAAAYRAIRLEALRCNPEAFGSTFQVENDQPLKRFVDLLYFGASIFGAFQSEELIGIAGLLLAQGKKETHKGTLVSMYVCPDFRKAGVGQRLVEAVVESAAQHHLELLQLAVVSGNDSALRLYQRMGFVQYGIEPRALKQDGQYFDEILMWKDLRADSFLDTAST